MRNKILDILSSSQGEFISGESISETLEITRAAVWKQIKNLKDAGYVIEGQTKKGYRLLSTPCFLDQWALKKELRTNTLCKELYLFEELPSTNEYCKDLVRQGASHGTVVIAKKQTQGHGRMQRSWESPLGGLWLSVILKPSLNLGEVAKLTLSTGVALGETLRQLYDIPVGIKWPNDIVVEGKKIAGILGEVVGEWNTVHTLILGIGINGNFPRNALSPDLPATTLQDILQKDIDLNLLARELLRQLEKEVSSLEAGDSQGLLRRWTGLALGIGEEVIIQRANQIFKGIFKGIRENGELILEIDGQEMNFSSGEVSLRSEKDYSPNQSSRK
ncbi:MAG: biotin--[acetyl-CoA-carboxylase] ligase [Desulfitobacterium sp.]|nr:biotin--[acetyl-CoA-carboxylase] ligase [Desulfitobacterium sp.]